MQPINNQINIKDLRYVDNFNIIIGCKIKKYI